MQYVTVTTLMDLLLFPFGPPLPYAGIFRPFSENQGEYSSAACLLFVPCIIANVYYIKFLIKSFFLFID